MKRVLFFALLLALVFGLQAEAKRIVLLDIEKNDSSSGSIAATLTKTDMPALFTDAAQFTPVDAKSVKAAVKKLKLGAPSTMDISDMTALGNELTSDLVLRGSVQMASGNEYTLTIDILSTRTTDFKRFNFTIPSDPTARMALLKSDLLTKIIDMTASEFDRKFAVCQNEYNNNDFAAAEPNLINYITIDAKKALAYLYLGDIYLTQNKYDKAVDILQKGLVAIPNDPDLLSKLSDVYVANGDTDDAVNTLMKLAELKPDDSSPWIRIAKIYNDLGDKDKVLDALRGAYRKAPDNNHLRQLLADQLLDAQLYEEALPHYEALVDVFPNDTTIERKLALCYQQTQKFDEAIARYNSALQSHPDDVRLHSRRAETYLDAMDIAKSDQQAVGYADGAIEDYQFLAQKDPNNAASYTALASAYMKAADTARRMKDSAKEQSYNNGSVQALQNAVKIAPDDANVLITLANQYFSQGKMQDAERTANTVIQKDSNSSVAYLLLYLIYQNYGIDRYNAYADQQSRYQNSTAVGSQKDALKAQYVSSKADAHSTFIKAKGYLDQAKAKSTDPTMTNRIQTYMSAINQYIQNTEPGFFDK